MRYTKERVQNKLQTFPYIIYHILQRMSSLLLKEGCLLEETLSKFLSSSYPIEKERDDLLKINEETAQYGLALKPQEAFELAQTHRAVLENCCRVEIGFDTVQKIIRAFSPSKYLYKKNYADVINEAVEAFYELKDESDDRISDDDLISRLADAFERYGGDMKGVIQSRKLMRLLKAKRFGRDYDVESIKPKKKDTADDSGKNDEDDNAGEEEQDE